MDELFLLPALVLAVIIHEAGHAAAAFGLRLPVHVISVLGVGYDFHNRRFGVQRSPKTRKMLGFVRLDSASSRIKPRNFVLSLLAGPAANIATAFLAAVLCPDNSDSALSRSVTTFVVVSMLAGLVSLIPLRDNDGRQPLDTIRKVRASVEDGPRTPLEK